MLILVSRILVERECPETECASQLIRTTEILIEPKPCSEH